MIEIYVLFGALGYALASFTHRDEAKFWKSRADYWFEDANTWMNVALRGLDAAKDRAPLPDRPRESPSRAEPATTLENSHVRVTPTGSTT